MRGKRRKDIEKYVDATFPMLAPEPVYQMRADGTIVLSPACRRGIVQRIKRNYTKRRRGEF